MLLKPPTCSGCPLYEPPYGKRNGFSVPSGTGHILILAEALGEHEEKEGVALVGKAGYYLFQQLSRVDIQREQFTLFNCIACRPPDNKLVKMPYEVEAIEHCRPNREKVITETRQSCERAGKTFVIVTLGNVAFKQVLGLSDKDPILRQDFYCYPFYSHPYKAWVIPVPHPSYLMRGNNHLIPVLQFAFKRALEIAEHGLTLDTPQYLLDPDPPTFSQWVNDYLQALDADPSVILSYDIETPYKQKKTEEDLAKEDDADHTILRCSFCYRPGEGTSVRWSAEYMAGIEALFSAGGALLGWNSDLYDKPRVLNHLKMTGPSIDGMVAWHILNTSLPKGLGFVTPFYVQNTTMWKHLSDSQPAFYNMKDADMALRNYIGIAKNLVQNKLWPVFERHVLQLNKALDYMSQKGLLRDNEMRQAAEEKLSLLLDTTELKMEASVPMEARRLKVYKKTPADTEGMIQVEQVMPVKRCSICHIEKPKKAHFKPPTKKQVKLGLDNVCQDGEVIVKDETVRLWAKPLEFKISKVSLTGYQKSIRHQAIISRKEKKVTFDEDAIVRLMKQYPHDPLYPLILDHRNVQGHLTKYIGITLPNGKLRGGMQIKADGRIHVTFTHNPATLRLAAQEPPLQQLPRPKGEDDIASIIRNLVIAGPEQILVAVDFAGIEAVLTGYFACDPLYIRLAKKDVHTYYTVYALHELDGSVLSSELPDITWPDEKLFPYLNELKSRFKKERNSLYKHLVHAANFMQSPTGAQAKIFNETRVEYPYKMVAKVMDIYFSLFPSIRRWHTSVLQEAEKDGYLRNPFSYVHRFHKVYNWKKECGKWTKKPNPDVANKVVAMKPQSTASAIIKEAILRLYFNRFEEAGQYLRLQVHDELLSETPTSKADAVISVMREEMERPIPELSLPASYRMGSHLVVETEHKRGYRWGNMH